MSTPSASCDRPKSERSYAEKLTKRSKKGRTDAGHPAIFLVPLEEGPCLNKGKYCSRSFGEIGWEYKTHKVIMLVGATGAGKSTLINAMTNYILGVKWEDNFRFKLVDEPVTGALSQAHTQTQITTSYTLHSNKHHRFPFTLTIIDTPGFGDTRGIEHDKAIVEQIGEFFSHPETHDVDHIDAVGFVVQASQARLTHAQKYIFESTLSLFGKDIKPNIILLITFWDRGEPAVLAAIKEANIPYSKRMFRFNNVALFEKNQEDQSESDSDEEEEVNHLKSYWQKGMKQTKKFFETVRDLEPKSLTLSKEVLEKRKHLEQTVERLQSQSNEHKDKIRELQKETEELERCKREIQENKSFEYEAEVIEHEEIETEAGKRSMNCGVCQYTCHYPCTRRESTKGGCYMMTSFHHNCRVCPERCSWEDHLLETKIHVLTKKNKMKTLSDIESRYRVATDKKLTVEELVEKIKSEIENCKHKEAELLAEIHKYTQDLERIALKPHPTGLNEYIDLLIEKEKKEAEAGWPKRVETLKSYKKRQGLLDSAKSKFNTA